MVSPDTPARGIGQSLAASNLITAAVALLVAGVVVVVYQFTTLRTEALHDLQAQATIVAINSSAAVVFDDQIAASDTLASLRVMQSLQAAAIFDQEHQRVAGFQRGARAERPLQSPEGVVPGHQFGLRELTVSTPIIVDGRTVGVVALNVSLDVLLTRILAFTGTFLAAGLGSLALSFPLMARMRRQMKDAEARLDQLAHYDPITGTYNRNAFNARLEEIALGADPAQFALLLIDLDDFKNVNDTLGHAIGDALLRQIAERLLATVRPMDRVYRVGGDEFAIILAGISVQEQAATVAERLFEQFSRPFMLDVHEIVATVSGGICLYPADAADMSMLSSNADTAMYLAKRQGKNRFEHYRQEMSHGVQHRLRLLNDLRRAIERNELTLHFQPQVRAGTLEMSGVEALLRWQHPELGAVSPVEFIPIAEESGLIVPIGRWVIAEACRNAAEWRASNLGNLRVAVNLSPRQSRDAGLLAHIDEVLANHGLSGHALELEITEGLLFDDVDSNLALLRGLRARGIHLAIDDFGTGYSSMAYLQRLPINKLKIDISFIRGIPGDGEVITSAIIAMAHRLGLSVVAEGVEFSTQIEFLRGAGCDFLQGYWMSAPVPAEEFVRLLIRGGPLDQAGRRGTERLPSRALT